MKKLYTAFTLISILFFSAFSPKIANASHAMGGEITYEHISGDTYKIIYTFLRDCTGIPASSSAYLQLFSTSCGYSANMTLPSQAGCVEISPLCPSYLSQSTCNGGSLPGVQKCIYSGNITLPFPCTDWTLSVSEAARSANINTIINPGSGSLCVYATINSTNNFTNNSVVCSNIYTLYYCVGQPGFFNFGAFDPDGDSLVYELITPLKAWNDPVIYISPYDSVYPIATTPVNSFGFDTVTGEMFFTPSTVQGGVLAVLIKEYRNHVLIGSTERDVQIVILNCNHDSPQLDGSGFVNLSGGDSLNAYSVSTCAGSTLSFEIIAVDSMQAGALTMTSDVGLQIPSAFLSISGGNPITASFTWTPTIADTGVHFFNVTVNDGNCPVSAMQVFNFSIYVYGGTFIESETAFYCGEPIQLSAHGGSSFVWTPSSGLSCDSCVNPIASPTVSTTYTVTSNLVSSFCQNWDTITVHVVSPFSFSAGDDDTICQNGLVYLNALVDTLFDPYTILWSPANSINCAPCPNPIANPTVTTTYTACATASNGCTLCDDVTIVVDGIAPVLDASASSLLVCIGDTFFLSATGSLSNYYWSSNSSSAIIDDPFNANTAAQIFETTIFYVESDSGNCTSNDFVVVEINESQWLDAVPDFISACFGIPVQLNANLYGTPAPPMELNCGTNSTPIFNPPFQSTLGMGSTYGGSTTYPNIFGNYYQGARHQILYRATDLTAAGITDDATITEIAFNIQSVNGASNYDNFQIKIGCTSLTTLTSWQVNGMSNVLTPQTLNITSGWNTIALTSSFDWDGTSNLIVEICFNNTSSTFNSSNYYTSTAYSSVVYYMQNSQNVCGSTNIFSVSTSRPNIRFTSAYPPLNVQYIWAPSLGLNNSNIPNPVAQPGATTTYTVQTTGTNCPLTDSVLVSVINCLGISVITTDVLCFGDSTGIAIVVDSFSTPPLQYSLDGVNYQSSDTFDNLPAGNYLVNVMDSLGVINGAVFTILQPQPISVSATTFHVSCYNGNDGSIDLLVSGGIQPYTFLWSNGSTTDDIDTLISGYYSVTVTDANNCTAQLINIFITQPNALILSTSVVHTSCSGCTDGSVDLTVSGGTPAYYFIWNTADNAEDISNLGAGIYCVTVTDVNGCTASTCATVLDSSYVILSETHVNVSCFGFSNGLIHVTVLAGASPFTYLWSNGETTQDLTNIPAGSYSITVTDANNATASMTVIISEPLILLFSETHVDVSVFGGNDGSIDLTVTGGTPPYMFYWSNGSNSEDIDSLVTGNYVVIIIDAHGCNIVATIQIGEPSLVEQHIQSPAIHLYPIPAQSEILISSVSMMEQIVIYDLIGKELLRIEELNELQISVSLDGISSGVYLVKIKTKEGEVMKKVEKE